MCNWQIGQLQNIKIHTWLSGWVEQHKRNEFWNLNATSFPLLPSLCSALKPSMNLTITFEKDHLFRVSDISRGRGAAQLTAMSEQHPKTTRHKLCCEKLGTSHDVKSFALGSFFKHFVDKIAVTISVKKHWTHSWNQCKINWFLVKFSQKIPMKSAFFYQSIVFRQS